MWGSGVRHHYSIQPSFRPTHYYNLRGWHLGVGASDIVVSIQAGRVHGTGRSLVACGGLLGEGTTQHHGQLHEQALVEGQTPSSCFCPLQSAGLMHLLDGLRTHITHGPHYGTGQHDLFRYPSLGNQQPLRELESLGDMPPGLPQNTAPCTHLSSMCA